jgi:CheY-like chemotaxis protein
LTIESSWTVQDASVLADATRLQQVLWNLLSNAVKFTPASGRIAVTAAQVDDRIRIEVSDSGIGIDRDFLPHVFDRFRQANSGTSRNYGGLGLGLAIVRDLVRLHGGDIEAHSDGDGLGSRFVVSLRASAAAPRPAERRTRSREVASLAGHRVMLLEDHQDSRELLTQALQNSGASVVAFGMAADAFAALERVQPSVIVADIGLPDEDGYSFIRRVRTHPVAPIRLVPAIAVTAYATGPDRDEALAVGFQQHLAKPIDPAHLVEAIHEITRRSRVS